MASFCNIIELIKVLCDTMKHIFRLFRFRHVMQRLVHLGTTGQCQPQFQSFQV